MSDQTEFLENGSGKPRGEPEAAFTMPQELFQTLLSLGRIVLLIIFLFTFVMRITVVDGDSMNETLYNKDVVLVRSIGYTPRAGDIVVLTKTSFRPQSIIKRVIATAGQTVDIDYKTSTVYVDGEAREEPWLWEAMGEPGWDDLNHVTVPEGCVFVMGDNRNNSSDSRLPSIGMVDARCVIGQAVVVIFPFGHMQVL